MDDIEAGRDITLKLKIANESDLEMRISSHGKVADLKQNIYRKLNLSNDKNLRLIFNGRLLDPPSSSLSLHKIRDGSYIHVVITNTADHRFSVNESATPVNTNASVPSGELRGLDVLMSQSGRFGLRLGVDEVSTIRAYFQDDITHYAEEHLTQNEGEANQDFRLRAETEWMSAQSGHSEFNLNLQAISMFTRNTSFLTGLTGASQQQIVRFGLPTATLDETSVTETDVGTFRDFFYGLLLGFTLGFMMIFCVWDRNISHRQKVGILTGIILQLLSNFYQNNQRLSSDNNQSSSRSHDLHQSVGSEEEIVNVQITS